MWGGGTRGGSPVEDDLLDAGTLSTIAVVLSSVAAASFTGFEPTEEVSVDSDSFEPLRLFSLGMINLGN